MGKDVIPFGEELSSGIGNRSASLNYSATQDSVRQRFTGYQKDTESGLDFAEARYYNNAHGRFTAVDPLLASGKSANPQTFNRYVYVMNSPLILADPSGMQAATAAGRWYRPNAPDGARTYVFSATQPQNYAEVTDRNRFGDLIGKFAGSSQGMYPTGEPDYVLRFNPNGPNQLSFQPQTVDVRNGQTSALPISDYDRNGWEIIKSDAYQMNNPATGAAPNAIEPHDVALALMPFKFSVGGKFTSTAFRAETAGSIRNVNPFGCMTNCANTAIATDATLAGRPASALRGGPTAVRNLEQIMDGQFSSATTRNAITTELTNAGHGARGVVFGSRGIRDGHFFNAVNQRGAIRFLDGQTGTSATWRGYRSFHFMRTN